MQDHDKYENKLVNHVKTHPRERARLMEHGSQSSRTTVNNPYTSSHKVKPKGYYGQYPCITSMEPRCKEAKYIV